jgi:acarbose 7IV-phosphotransferase
VIARRSVNGSERHVNLMDAAGRRVSGDAFFAGFLHAHLAGRPVRECMVAATRAAAACVRSRDLAGVTDGTRPEGGRYGWAPLTGFRVR